MSINFEIFLKKIKNGFFTSYPNLSDVLYELSCRQIPWFDVEFENGQKNALAIVNLSSAYDIIRYENIFIKIEDVNALKEDENPKIIFEAISPALEAWLVEKNYLSSSRTLALLFLKIAETGSDSLSYLAQDIAHQLNLEYQETKNIKTQSQILLAIKNLQLFF